MKRQPHLCGTRPNRTATAGLAWPAVGPSALSPKPGAPKFFLPSRSLIQDSDSSPNDVVIRSGKIITVSPYCLQDLCVGIDSNIEPDG